MVKNKHQILEAYVTVRCINLVTTKYNALNSLASTTNVSEGRIPLSYSVPYEHT